MLNNQQTVTNFTAYRDQIILLVCFNLKMNLAKKIS